MSTKELEGKLLILADAFKPLSMTQDELDGWYTSIKTAKDQRTDFHEAWQNTLAAIDEDHATSIRNFLKIYEDDKVDVTTSAIDETPAKLSAKQSTPYTVPDTTTGTLKPTPPQQQQSTTEVLQALQGSIVHQTQIINDMLEKELSADHAESHDLHELRVKHIRQMEETFTSTISLIDNELTNQRSDLKKLVQQKLDLLIQNLA